jgi:hypothetical protein
VSSLALRQRRREVSAHPDLVRTSAHFTSWWLGEQRDEEVGERPDAQGVHDGADPDGAAEQEAAGQHGQLDHGADRAD